MDVITDFGCCSQFNPGEHCTVLGENAIRNAGQMLL